MALANFFDKAAVAASAVLRKYERDRFAAMLSEHAIGVAFDDAAASCEEGQRALELSLNLLARLYPHLVLLPSGSRADALAPVLVDLARSINPDITIDSDLRDVQVCLTVGSARARTTAQHVYVGSHGWVARVSTQEPVGSGPTNIPFGAGASACVGVANVFRYTFRAALDDANLDRDLSLSLADYTVATAERHDWPSGRANIGEVHLVGVGAIGSGAVWALRHAADVQGVLHLIDPEAVDLTNLQRYVLTTQADVGRPKVGLAAAALADSRLDVRLWQQRWGEYLSAASANLQTVAVALDSAKDRIAVQASLPRTIFNAWTQPGDLGLSRHAFLGDGACLACLYLPDRKLKDRDELVAEAIGLPQERQRVRHLLYTNEAIGRPLLESITAALGVPIEELLSFAAQPLRVFYQEALCGGIVLRLGGGAMPPVEVPMAFQSAMAGIMLAAELVTHGSGLNEEAFGTVVRLNLLRPLQSYLAFRTKKAPGGRCLCQDSDYSARYRGKWGGSSEKW